MSVGFHHVYVWSFLREPLREYSNSVTGVHLYLNGVDGRLNSQTEYGLVGTEVGFDGHLRVFGLQFEHSLLNSA